MDKKGLRQAHTDIALYFLFGLKMIQIKLDALDEPTYTHSLC